MKLRRAGREWKGLCPFHQEQTASFHVIPDKDFYHCFGCGAHGDVFDFVAAHEGLDFAAALERLESDVGLQSESATRRESVKADPPSARIDGRRAAAIVWSDASPARGELPERFLKHRGIDPGANGLLDVARFHPRCPTHLWAANLGPESARAHCPALIAPMLRVSGGRGERSLSLMGVHVTFLGLDGQKKAFAPWRARSGEMVTPPSRVMWGTAAQSAVPVPARPITDRIESGTSLAEILCDLIDAPGPLVVAEGLETTQSLLAKVSREAVDPRTDGQPRMGWATLSLNTLQGAAARGGPRDSLRLFDLRGATDDDGQTIGGAFTIADPGRVIVGVDADMKPTAPQWVQERPRTAPVKRALTSDERSTVCAGLASWQWRHAGAERMAVIRPPMGQDFNDMDRGTAHG